ncbi:ATP-dependent DNA helicase [Pseudactinotalea sp. Z1748]|uniref:ATP-dependent DNA helicase n=1 Tax=Pseudactinotalea sp. Z1748 TaxID=3413027 RepID=UPI003C7A4435
MPCHLNLEDLLTKAVRNSTGLPDAKPRPGQLRLARDIDQVMQQGEGHALGAAPTGTGKSLAALVPAALLATQGARTLMSTESLGLQHQVVHKDFPAVRKAVSDTAGIELDIAVLKGWSNFACLASARAKVTEQAEKAGKPLPEMPQSTDDKAIDLAMASARATDPLTKWALSPENTTGDRADYDGAITDQEWEDISVTPDACAGASCPLLELCFPAKARQKAAAAQVVVTNHSMLAVQATKGVPVAIGSKSLGDFDAVVVDEAHALPSVVRGMGAVTINGRRLTSVARAASAQMPPGDLGAQKMSREASDLASHLEQAITAAAKTAGGNEARVDDDDDPLGDLAMAVTDWCGRAIKMVEEANSKARGLDHVRVLRTKARIQRLVQDLREVRTGGLGIARWYELPDAAHNPRGPVMPSLCMSPVDVSSMLQGNVWTAPVHDDDDEHTRPDHPEGEREDGQEDSGLSRPRRELPVVAISATLPKSFAHEVGLSSPIVAYESPFATAYANSLLYIPRTSAGGSPVPTRTYGSKTALATGEHPTWALGLMRQLIEANGGSALVLSATAAAGRRYVEELRAHSAGRWQVLSQWDGLSKEIITRTWRDDEPSVLVGTRSYMTGVDAPGRTCSLVIIDRVPRSAGNVVDDARVEVVAQHMNEFRARETVYAGDASQLLAQAAGRLIRSTADTGVVAILDPRLLKKQSVTYPSTTRSIYMRALEHFESKTANLDAALDHLQEASGLAVPSLAA